MTVHRTKDGKFVKGNGVKGGRPKSVNTDYAKLIRDCLTPTAAFEIIDKAIEHAKAGDARARSWLFSHVVAPIPKTIFGQRICLKVPRGHRFGCVLVGPRPGKGPGRDSNAS